MLQIMLCSEIVGYDAACHVFPQCLRPILSLELLHIVLLCLAATIVVVEVED